MNTSWQQLDSETAEIRKTPILDEGRIEMYVSPFQVPEAFRQLESGEMLTLELRYMDEGEATRTIVAPDGVELRIGKQSGRLFAISLPRKIIEEAIRRQLGKGAVAADIVHQFSCMPRKRELRPGQIDNYAVTERIFRRSAPRFA